MSCKEGMLIYVIPYHTITVAPLHLYRLNIFQSNNNIIMCIILRAIVSMYNCTIETSSFTRQVCMQSKTLSHTCSLAHSLTRWGDKILILGFCVDSGLSGPFEPRAYERKYLAWLISHMQLFHRSLYALLCCLAIPNRCEGAKQQIHADESLRMLFGERTLCIGSSLLGNCQRGLLMRLRTSVFLYAIANAKPSIGGAFLKLVPRVCHQFQGVTVQFFRCSFPPFIHPSIQPIRHRHPQLDFSL